MHKLLLLCLSAVVTVEMPSQSTILVGPGAHPQIRAALAVAQPGDTILVSPGVYAHFAAIIGVTIRAEIPGSVLIDYEPSFAPPGCFADPMCIGTEGPTRLAPPPGQHLHLIGLHFLPTSVTVGLLSIIHRVVISSGTVTMDDCRVRSIGNKALQVDNATLILTSCSVSNENALGLFAPALDASNAHITAVDSTLRGAPQTPGFYASSEGAKLVGSTLHGSFVELRGGSNRLQAGAPALIANNSLVWLSDSTLLAGNAACATVASGGSVQLARCSVVSTGVGCTTPPTAPLVGVHRAQPLLLGSTFALQFQGDPNCFVFLSAGSQLTTLSLFELVQPLSLHPSTLVIAGVLLGDATGLAAGAWNVPNNPALVDATLWFQGATSLTLPLQMTPVTGGVIR